jgi:hypothetical protein
VSTLTINRPLYPYHMHNCCNNVIGGDHCHTLHQLCPHVIPGHSCVLGQSCTSIVPSDYCASISFINALLSCCSNVFLDPIVAKHLAPQISLLLNNDYNKETRCFTTTDFCVSQQWLPNLAHHSQRLTRAGFAFTSEVRTSASLQ